jgi:hypothetical protein
MFDFVNRFSAFPAYRIRRRVDALKVDSSRVAISIQQSAVLIQGAVRTQNDVTALVSGLLQVRGVERVIDDLRVEGEAPNTYTYVALKGHAAGQALDDYYNGDSASR